ncbi:MAG: DUF6326 family protein [Anaerolineae bacterium]
MKTDNSQMEAKKARLSTLWMFIMLNMAFADIFSFMSPTFQQEVTTGLANGTQITQGFLLVAAFVLEIPLAMVLLARVLKYEANRPANIVAGVVTIAFVIGGGSSTPHYIFFATIEVICALFVIGYAWRWTQNEGQHSTITFEQSKVGGHS